METIVELLRRHEAFDPAHGHYEDAPTDEELWAANSADFYELVNLGVLTDTVRDGVVVKSKEEKYAALCERYGGGSFTPQDEQRLIEINYQRNVARLTRAGVPRMYLPAVVDSRLNDKFAKGMGLYLYGPVGVGKTYAAVSLLKGWMKANLGGDPIFATAPQMMSELASTYGTSTTMEEAMQRYIKAPFLVIDDLGKEVASEVNTSRLWRVLTERCTNYRPTIITSQMEVAEMLASPAISEDEARSIGSRIKGCYVVEQMTGSDRRIA